jgi:hypothetical protein
MNGPTRSRGQITIRVKILQHAVVLWSGGTTYEIQEKSVYVMPKEMKQHAEAEWDNLQKKYIVLSKIYVKGGVIIEPMTIDEFINPSEAPISFVYRGEAVKRFISLTRKILSKYYKGGSTMSLPLSNKECYRFAVALARMSQLQSISDVL